MGRTGCQHPDDSHLGRVGLGIHRRGKRRTAALGLAEHHDALGQVEMSGANGTNAVEHAIGQRPAEPIRVQPRRAQPLVVRGDNQ